MMFSDWIVMCNDCSRGNVIPFQAYDEDVLKSLDCRFCHSDNINVTDRHNHVILRENDLIHAALDI